MGITIRHEIEADQQAVRLVNEAAFGRPAEANLVDALRAKGAATISLVAEEGGVVVGHILFSPVTLSPPATVTLLGLAPLSVLPARQGQGIGSALVREGLRCCSLVGCAVVVVLGHRTFYPRFGFAPSVRYGIRSEYDVPDDVFMVAELVPGALNGLSGLIHYDAAFAGF